MAAKGSRRNPYTLSEFNGIGSDSWTGGWIKESDNYIIYRNRYLTETYTGCCSKSNPVPGDMYSEMAQYHIWLGGWVLFGATLRYLDSNNNEYNSSLGSQSNPCSWFIYNEMLSNGIWAGGWVLDSNGIPHYVRVFQIDLNSGEGCGCGCSGSSGNGSGSDGNGSGSDGCGSGSDGCGSGSDGCGCDGSGDGGEQGGLPSLGYPISAGSCKGGDVNATLTTGTETFFGEIYIEWTAGNTVGFGLSVATVSLRINNPFFSLTNNSICTIWTGAYELGICGSFTVLYNQVQHVFSINGTFPIPDEYRQ